MKTAMIAGIIPIVAAAAVGFAGGFFLCALSPARYCARIPLTAVRSPLRDCPSDGAAAGGTFAHLGTIRDLLQDPALFIESGDADVRRIEDAILAHSVRTRADSHLLSLEVEAASREAAAGAAMGWADKGMRRVNELIRNHIDEMPEELRPCVRASTFLLEKPLPWRPTTLRAGLTPTTGGAFGAAAAILGTLGFAHLRRRVRLA